ncbi:dUTPase [Fictibacillus sp. Mic-4]|uniref:dUTPase n=1 Tax=Fictibacillus sp. Mic-4 TaxID=3132826 RepID=UPI003CEE2DF6
MTYSNEEQWRWANEQDGRKEKIRKTCEQHAEVFRELAKTGDASHYDDRLEAIFDMQYALDKRIIEERGINKGLDEWVIGITLAMESEIDEIRREVNWKWWKNPKEIDRKALQGEVIDMWHFLVSLSQKVGLTPADVYRVYREKNAENHARQDGKSDKEGYEVNAE